jgi:hypothetical protein
VVKFNLSLQLSREVELFKSAEKRACFMLIEDAVLQKLIVLLKRCHRLQDLIRLRIKNVLKGLRKVDLLS